jgi:hypothetical protein
MNNLSFKQAKMPPGSPAGRDTFRNDPYFIVVYLQLLLKFVSYNEYYQSWVAWFVAVHHELINVQIYVNKFRIYVT